MLESSGQTPLSLYKIEPLRDNNWIPWKIKIKAILNDRGLEGHIDGAKPRPVFVDAEHPTEPEQAALDKWQSDDRKTQTMIKLLLILT
ncbi:hypothetical protein AZE42_13777 [Rhizopogon vesiculosus]|uniref:Retrotransposon Copia-like N-terminal domain-containing protein n=1 Tax=Rhizopogon vesiculosus TaxID=180088 RepID=A0A1J8QPR8_9AGAM|nr:hypothetical protein AZE42_13777 [Rhizopogon vesiculosus]